MKPLLPLPDPLPPDPIQRISQQRILYGEVPDWRHDKSYFWAAECARKKALPWACPKACPLCRPLYCVGYCR